jgi:ankyrin repeat protein
MVIIYVLIDCVRIKKRQRKDCDTSTGKQKELNNLLSQAVADGDAQKVKETLAAGANVKVRGLGGKTPLIRVVHRAADAKHYDDEVNLIIAKLLIEKGADVNTKDLFSGSAIEYCDWQTPGTIPQIIEFLQKNGAQKFPLNSKYENGL